MAEPFSLNAISAAITSFWGRSAILLWCLAASCLVALIALVAGAHWRWGDAPAFLAKYGTALGLAFLVLLVFAAFKTYSERPKPTLSLLPEDGQSFCGQSRQADGRITTQLSLRFQVTNLTDGAIMLSRSELRRPMVRRHSILTNILMVRRPNSTVYGSQYPVPPRSLTYGLATIMINQPVGSAASTMRAVVALQDHTGRWHKLIFPHLPIRRAQT
jgi:hypothetical protein